MDFLRTYRKGTLITTAQALLIDLLPLSLKDYLDSGRYVETLVLAKQNRELFQNNWIDITLLAQLADAYFKLSIYDESKSLYLYLLEHTDKNGSEPYYLPLISCFFNLEDYLDVENYFSEYFYNYPAGKDRETIFTLMIRSLIASGDVQEAKSYFTHISPDNKNLHIIAASVAFAEMDYLKTEQHLSPFFNQGQLFDLDAQYMLAESYYHTGDYETAKTIFLSLVDISKITDQTKYRLASIARRDGNEKEALKLFQEIVETGVDPLWKKLAAKELEFEKLKKIY